MITHDVARDLWKGLSTDTKPGKPDAKNGDKWVNIDDGKESCFDEENETWYEWGAEPAEGESV